MVEICYQISSCKKSLKQRWDFSDKKGFQPWSDLLKFKAEISLKQRLVFSDTNMDCNYCHISFQWKLKKLKNGGISQIKRIATMVRFA